MTRECPNCERANTEPVHEEFHDDYALQVHYCRDCGSEWDRAYSQPEVMEVRTND